MFFSSLVARVAQGLGLGVVTALGVTAGPAAAAPPPPPVGCSAVQLSAAIATANTMPGSVLTLSSNCTYTLNSPLPAISTVMTINGKGSTITRAGSAPAFRILTVAAGGNLTLSKTTLSNGLATGGFPDNFGGGIANFGILDLESDQILNNRADFSGGIGNVGTATVDSTTVTGNSTTHNGGGAANDGTMTITKSRFIQNSADQLGGGLANDGTMTVRDSNVNDNVALDGGGIANLVIGSNHGNLLVDRTNVNSNRATGGTGAGGILNQPGASVVLTSSRVNGNTPTNCAGAVPGC
ncbi:hypothetical protein [Streptomyces collinus]|uniref:hypothetical protein n=1 Tax=Streptomyces collinus TaxID=42684 RepID=UPI003643D0CE